MRGGLNTFTYVSGNPLQTGDLFGLDRTIWAGGPGRWMLMDGPRNGNWCGGNWSGGKVPSQNGGKDGTLPPMDSLDSCCKLHDNCYSTCERLPNAIQYSCYIKCDREMVGCLKHLDDDCTKWPSPPRMGTEGDSQVYRDDAMRLFNERIREWEQKELLRRQ